jgi:flavin reductase (DIM6/NTAB) family NADH-FMN oxidoreductase RutF
MMSTCGNSLPRFQAPDDAFRAAFRELAGAVCVLSCAAEGQVFALPAVSVAEAPSSEGAARLVVCANSISPCWPAFAGARLFGVNILASDQREAAYCLCDHRSAGQFEQPGGVNWIVSGGGAPLLADALVSFDCQSEEMIERESCAIVFARAIALRRNSDSGALIHWRGALEQVGWSAHEIANAIGVSATRRSREARARD